MIFIIFTIGIFLVGTILSYFLFVNKIAAPEKAYNESIKNIENLVEDRKKSLKDAAQFSLGFIDVDYYEQLHKQVEELSGVVYSKKQQVLSLENEVLKAELSLKEVEDVKKEIEITQIETKKEVDLLKAQDSDMAEQNAQAKQALQDIIKNVSPIFEALASLEGSDAIVDALFMQTGNADQKLEFFQTEIQGFNKKYLELKEQYDALDIEYAQLYEKTGG